MKKVFLLLLGMIGLVSCSSKPANSTHEHNYEEIEVKGTCIESGYIQKVCSMCQDSYIIEYTEALGHNFGLWEEVKKASCTEEGIRKRTCFRCNKEQIEPISSLSHNFVIKEEKAPTCLTDGERIWECTNDSTHFYSETIPSVGHQMMNWEVTKQAGCGIQGEEKRKCGNCSYFETRVIEGHNHKYKAEVTKNPTCEEDGEKRYVCEYDSTHFYTETLNKVGHNYRLIEIQNPTCKTEGYKRYQCVNNPEHIYDEILEKVEHNYGAWQVKIPATCEEGTEERSCLYCHETETREVRGHKLVKGKCTLCGYQISSDEVYEILDSVDMIYDDMLGCFKTTTTNPSSIAVLEIKINVDMEFITKPRCNIEASGGFSSDRYYVFVNDIPGSNFLIPTTGSLQFSINCHAGDIVKLEIERGADTPVEAYIALFLEFNYL